MLMKPVSEKLTWVNMANDLLTCWHKSCRSKEWLCGIKSDNCYGLLNTWFQHRKLLWTVNSLGTENEYTRLYRPPLWTEHEYTRVVLWISFLWMSQSSLHQNPFIFCWDIRLLLEGTFLLPIASYCTLLHVWWEPACTVSSKSVKNCGSRNLVSCFVHSIHPVIEDLGWGVGHTLVKNCDSKVVTRMIFLRFIASCSVNKPPIYN
jgi:hypothetical protein